MACPLPIDGDSRAEYFDALYYSSAVVGINTSAFIEAGIIGRPVYAIILADEFSGTQAGTIHFRYLTEVGGGIAQAGREFTLYGRGKRLLMAKDEFVAAAVNETPRTLLVEKVRERTAEAVQESSEADAMGAQADDTRARSDRGCGDADHRNPLVTS